MSSPYQEANPADVEEQSAPLADDPDDLEDTEDTDALPRPDVPEEANEADVLEQSTPVSGADDDYPNDLEAEPDV